MNSNKERFKQIFLTCFAFFLIGLGYFNYSSNEKNAIEVSADYNEVNLGDVELVSSNIVPNEEFKTDIVPNETEKTDYYTETRLERDKMYAEMIETYQKMIKTEEVPADQKAICSQEITNITNQKNSVMIAENLIKNKGFEDVVILVNENKVSVIVKSSILNQEEISKIQNIIQRQLDVEISNISITNK